MNDKISKKENTQENKQFVKSNEARKYYKVDPVTLRRWADSNKIEYIRTPGGTRLYNIKSISDANLTELKSESITPSDSRKKYCYCRVSTNGQRDDLTRQVSYMQNLYPTHIVIRDIGSGINFKRKGLQTILDECFSGNVSEIVVAYKDRLCRFGFELYESIFTRFKVKLVVLNSEISDPEKDLTTDLLSIINVFSAKINGRRKYKTIRSSGKEKEEENRNEEEKETNKGDNS